MRVFDAVHAMLNAESLGELIGARVHAFTRSPMRVEHFSGSVLERVRVEHAQGVTWLVLKQFSSERDWVMRLTHDTGVREVTLARLGIFAQMPSGVCIPIIAAAREGASWSSLMQDVSDTLIPLDPPCVPAYDMRQCLDGLAAVHVRWMNDAALREPSLGLSSLYDFLTILSPAVVQRELDAGRTHRVLEAAREGWARFFEIAPPRVARVMQALQNDPSPLLDELTRVPSTLLHGDFKYSNLGLARTSDGTVERVVMLDWQDSAPGPPLLDLGYFLAVSTQRLSLPKDEIIEIYRNALGANGANYSDDAWRRVLDLGLLGGGALRLIWQKALAADSRDVVTRQLARDDLDWWSDLILRAAQRFEKS